MSHPEIWDFGIFPNPVRPISLFFPLLAQPDLSLSPFLSPTCGPLMSSSLFSLTAFSPLLPPQAFPSRTLLKTEQSPTRRRQASRARHARTPRSPAFISRRPSL
nr:unnamed protein product [Digitaria exilis]